MKRKGTCFDAVDVSPLILIYAGSDAVLVTATLNCLSILIRTRQSVTNKIVSAVLSFNPLKDTSSALTPKAKVQIKAMERTTRALLTHVYRR